MRDWTPEAEALAMRWSKQRLLRTAPRRLVGDLLAFAAEVARATRAEAARAALDESADPASAGAPEWAWGYVAGRRDAAAAIEAGEAPAGLTLDEQIAWTLRRLDRPVGEWLARAWRLADATCAWEDAEVAELGAAAVSARYAELLAARDAYRAARGTP